MSVLDNLLRTFYETCFDVLPIAAVIVGFQTLVLRRQIPNLSRVLFGSLLVMLGLTLFMVGLELALFPLGETMAKQLSAPGFINATPSEQDAALPSWHQYYWTYIFAFAIGVGTTVAEPALIAVSIKAQDVSSGSINAWYLRLAVALGVGIGVSLGAMRIVIGTPLPYIILSGYVVVVIQTCFAPKAIVPLAYDSGGVTTSTVTVPLVAALGLGLASQVPGRDPLIDGFGLIAFASLFPMMTVMGYAQIAQWANTRARRQQGKADRTVIGNDRLGLPPAVEQ
jgi:Protein of unknown function (DUF1538)